MATHAAAALLSGAARGVGIFFFTEPERVGDVHAVLKLLRGNMHGSQSMAGRDRRHVMFDDCRASDSSARVWRVGAGGALRSTFGTAFVERFLGEPGFVGKDSQIGRLAFPRGRHI